MQLPIGERNGVGEKDKERTSKCKQKDRWEEKNIEEVRLTADEKISLT